MLEHRAAAASILSSLPCTALDCGLLAVSVSDMRSSLAAKHSDIATGIVDILAECAAGSVGAVSKAYEGIIRSMSAPVHDIDTLVGLRESCARCEESVASEAARLGALSPLFAALERCSFVATREALEARWRAEEGAARVMRKCAGGWRGFHKCLRISAHVFIYSHIYREGQFSVAIDL